MSFDACSDYTSRTTVEERSLEQMNAFLDVFNANAATPLTVAELFNTASPTITVCGSITTSLPIRGDKAEVFAEAVGDSPAVTIDGQVLTFEKVTTTTSTTRPLDQGGDDDDDGGSISSGEIAMASACSVVATVLAQVV